MTTNTPADAIAEFIADEALAHQVFTGPATGAGSTVDLGGGNVVKTVAKVVSDIETAGIDAVGDAADAAVAAATNWATETGAYVSGTDLSAKEWAIGVFKRGVAAFGSAKDWATLTGAFVDNAALSAKEWAIGSWKRGVAGCGSAKDWAVLLAGFVDDTGLSAKEWAVGVWKRGVAGYGSAKDWACYIGGTVDDTSYSAKKYANDASASATAAAASAGALAGNTANRRTVDVVVTSNIGLTGAAGHLVAGTTVDGVALTAGMRALLTAQTTGSQDGVYDVPASGNAARSADSDTTAEMPPGLEVFVTQGTAYAGTSWLLFTTGITLNTTALTFVQRDEVKTSSVTSGSIGTSYAALTSLLLGPGTWEVTAGLLAGTGSVSTNNYILFNVGQTSGSAAGTVKGKSAMQLTLNSGGVGSGTVPPHEITVTANTTIYLNALTSTASDTIQGAYLHAKRLRPS